MKHESFKSYSDDRQPRTTQTKVELRKSAKAVHAFRPIVRLQHLPTRHSLNYN